MVNRNRTHWSGHKNFPRVVYVSCPGETVFWLKACQVSFEPQSWAWPWHISWSFLLFLYRSADEFFLQQFSHSIIRWDMPFFKLLLWSLIYFTLFCPIGKFVRIFVQINVTKCPSSFLRVRCLKSHESHCWHQGHWMTGHNTVYHWKESSESLCTLKSE